MDKEELIEEVIDNIREDLTEWGDTTALEILLDNLSEEDLQAYLRNR